MSNKALKTIKLYDIDSHEKQFTARVLSCTPSGSFFKVELDQTLFFPEGGGQPADPGVIRFICNNEVIETYVSDVKIVTEDSFVKIYHFTDVEINVGTEVTGILDWDKRFTRMQNHSGEHVVSGIIHSMFGYENIGFHLTDDYATCDYNGALTWNEVREIEQRANEAVFANLPISAKYPSPEELGNLEYRSKLDLTEDVRIVTIEGIDVCACCAPHVNYTGEIGLIKIVNIEKSHGGTRLHLRCGRLALLDYDEKQVNILKIMDLLSARQFETAECTEKLISTNSELSHIISKKSGQLALCKLEQIQSTKEGNLVVYIDNADTDALRTLANGGKSKCTGIFVALTNHEIGYRYMITTQNNEIELSKEVRDYNSSLLGRGGGKNDMVQGTFGASLDEIKKFFKA